MGPFAPTLPTAPQDVVVGRERARDRSGRRVPFLWVRPAAPPRAVVAFGHGFLSAPSLYAGTFAALAVGGIAVAAPTTRTGPLPSHAGLAGDLRAVLVAASALVRRETGRLPALGLAGHSMGGGAAVLAAAGWPAVGGHAGLPPVQALVLLSPAQTRPQATRAAVAVRAPALTVVGSADRIVVPATSRRIHDALPSGSVWLELDGGSHCGFLDRPVPFCDKGNMPREDQLRRTRTAAVEWFQTHLIDDGTAAEA